MTIIGRNWHDLSIFVKASSLLTLAQAICTERMLGCVHNSWVYLSYDFHYCSSYLSFSREQFFSLILFHRIYSGCVCSAAWMCIGIYGYVKLPMVDFIIHVGCEILCPWTFSFFSITKFIWHFVLLSRSWLLLRGAVGLHQSNISLCLTIIYLTAR